MFDFQKLEVYKKSKSFHISCCEIIESESLNSVISDQLFRASFSVCLNIGEGSGRFSRRDRRHFFVMARSSIFECIAALDILTDRELIDKNLYDRLFIHCDELSRILFSMIRNLE